MEQSFRKKYKIFSIVISLMLLVFSGKSFAQQLLEAESANHSLNLQSSGSASGGQYLEMQGSGSVTWAFNAATSGVQDLKIVFSSPYGYKKQYAFVNGQSIGEIEFDQSSNFAEKVVSVNLNAGNNTFEIQKSWGWMNFDALIVPSAVSNTAPTANFVFSPLLPYVGNSVSFDGSASTDDDGNIASYAWDFGDGSTGSGVTASHAYSNAGTYTVTLTVTDDGGLSDTTTATVSVSTPPTTTNGISEAEDANYTLTLMSDVNASGGQYLEMQSSGSVIWTFESNGGSQEVIVRFRSPHGAKEQFLKVNGQDQGKVSFPMSARFADKTLNLFLQTGTNTLEIGAEWGWMDLDAIITEPVTGISVAFDYSPSTPVVSESISFDGSASQDDGSLIAYQWNFGDGNTASGAFANHSYASTGTYEVTLTVTDNDGNSESLMKSLEVYSGVPIALFVATPSLPRPDETVQFDATDSFDPNGFIVSYDWNFGDGNTASGSTNTHNYPNEGEYMVSLTITDDQGNTTTSSQTIHVSDLKRSIDSNVTLETAKLYTSLDTVGQSNQIIFGHQETTRYGTDFIHVSGQPVQSAVQTVTNDFPGVYGWEIGVDDLGVYSNPLDNPILAELMIDAYDRGGVNSIAWHMPNPAGGTSWDNTSGDSCHRILPGNDLHNFLVERLDKFASFASNLYGADGKQVPLLFRPWHEHNGDWFWWGSTGCSETDYIALWKFTVEYLRDTKGVHNLLYTFSPDASRSGGALYRYPGDDYVDILGVDNYYHLNNNNLQAFIDSIREVSDVAAQKNKVAAITETGHDYGQGCDSGWFSRLLSGIKSKTNQASGLAYVLVWRNANFATENRWHYYVPKSTDDCDATGFGQFHQDPITLFHGDLPNMY